MDQTNSPGRSESRDSRSSDLEQYPPMPVIVGAPRSGTTLLRFMLDAHPDLAIPPETGFLRLCEEWFHHDVSPEKFHHALTSFPESMPAWADFGVRAEDFHAALSQLVPFTVADGFRTFYRLYAERFGKSRWGDKTPLHSRYIDAIRRVIPEARFIHIIRDGRDVALSLREMWFSPGREMEIQAAHWRDWVVAAREAGRGQPDYLEVRYEALIREPESVIREICSLIDLDFQSEMLDYHRRTPERLQEHRARYRADGSLLISHERRLEQLRLTTRPPDPTRVLGWKTAMSDEDRTRFEAIAGELLRDLGYEE